MAYLSNQGVNVAKPLAPSQAVPTDHRSYFYDTANFKWRPYVNTAEVLSYLDSATKRTGHFPIIINTGGSLSSGVITGGTNAEYWFKDGTADANLVLKQSAAVIVGHNEANLVDGTTVTWDFATADVVNWTIQGSGRTLAISNMPNEKFGRLKVTQDATGGRTFTFPAGSKGPSGLALTATAGAVDELVVYKDDTGIYWWTIENNFITLTGGGGGGPQYLTWQSLDTDLETYNSAHGLRKKASSSAAWGDVAWSNQTVSSGQSVIVKVDGGVVEPVSARNFGLNAAVAGTASGAPGWRYNLLFTLSGTVTVYENGTTAAGGQDAATYVHGNFFRISYNVGNVTYAKSTDGVSWTTFFTSAQAPSGDYLVGLEFYNPGTLSQLNEISKQ